MAEFKLGRIKFVWKNSWTQNTQYYKDDVVQDGNRIYICVQGHVSASNFATDFNISPAKWNVMSDGQSWKGDWQTATGYKLNDIVKYQSNLYIATSEHTSAVNFTDDAAKWDLFATGLTWKNTWTISTDYFANDLVKYGGNTYICITAHTSSDSLINGLELDANKWQLFAQGLEYKNDWITSFRYKVNDIVKYGAGLYICTAFHTSSTFDVDILNWDSFVEGIKFEDEWVYTTLYQPGDIVIWGGYQYIAVRQNSNVKPTASILDWQIFSKGLVFKGEWGEDSSNQEYLVGEIASVGGYNYIATVDNLGYEPGRTVNWEDYWTLLSPGFEWRGVWEDDRYYVEGDVVRYGSSSYVCINSHISEGDDFSTETLVDPGGGAGSSRPDQDITGVYWNILVVGTETDVLTTKGDIVYYGGAGPTRLPIGTDGQVLSVSPAGIPEWTFVGNAPDVYYVSSTGIDLPYPVRGGSIESTWASIRYACEQVEKGAKNPNARILLELNRVFIQRETVEWTDYQIANNIAPFTTSFDYDRGYCERDIGYIVDAIIYDLTHGGNVKIREAALSYLERATNTFLYEQPAETVASLNYALEMMEDILNQNAIFTYQDLDSDNSTAIVDQYFNSAIEAENVISTITNLMKQLTDAITDGTENTIPTRIEPNTLIRISTGSYEEVLPIIVPARCCVMGDELRSVTVSPRTDKAKLIPKRDIKYTYEAYARLQDVIGNIVTGQLISKTAGNNESQYTEWPTGGLSEAATATQLARITKRLVDHGLGTKLETIYTPAYDLTTPQFGYARDNILLNKDWIKEEISAYINTEFPNLRYSRTKCKQDIGYILDAIAFDLTYEGNWASITAGLAYYAGRTGNFTINTLEKTATIDAYNYLSNILQTLSTNNTVSPAYYTGTDQQQLLGPNSGNSTTSNVILNLMNDITTIIDNVDNTPILAYPTITGAAAQLQSDVTDLDAEITGIQEKTIDFIITHFGDFTYKGNYCRRDIGYLIEGGRYDAVLGSNFWGIQGGLAYNRAQASRVKTEQSSAEIGSIEFIRDKIAVILASNTTLLNLANASYNELLDIFINGDTSADAISLSEPGVIAARANAKNLLILNRAFIISAVRTYIETTYSTFWNGLTPAQQTKCQDDIGRALDAFTYDVNYDTSVGGDGCNIATRNVARALFNNISGACVYTDANQRSIGVSMYTYLGNVCQSVILETFGGQSTTGSPGTSVEGDKMDDLAVILTDVLTANDITTLAAEVTPDITWTSAETQTLAASIVTESTTITNDTLQFITTTYSGFDFDHEKCSRDLEMIMKAASYDWCTGSNGMSIITAYSYLRQPSAKVYGNQKDATIAANYYARNLAKTFVSNASSVLQLDNTFELVNDILFAATNEAKNASVDNPDTYGAIKLLELNKELIVEEAVAYVNNYFKDTNITITSSILSVTNTNWLSLNMPIIFTSETTDLTTIGLNQTVYVKEILSSTTFTVSSTIGATAASLPDVIVADNINIEKEYIFNSTLCRRDIRTIVDAMKWDLQYPKQYRRSYSLDTLLLTYSFSFEQAANYKTKLAARYYLNAVIGSQEEDMYYLRNGTGLRLQTVKGLNGDLSPVNEYGTSRPTAGAYASLDPGWGPDDERVWITERSPYVQGVTTFGRGAVGQKIDGALHNGGNDSIVSNDFTQVISDGIGAWITNNGRAELVSVFTYYAHIGYLAEGGGKIRATNGNNSYGEFGSVAEGVDITETPVTAIVDNILQFNAAIGEVPVDGDKIINLEFNHAGNDYTEAQIDVFGSGSGAVVEVDEFRDAAVNRVRILDPTVEGSELGGTKYTLESNTAQTGTLTSITLAATDGNPDSAYPGMRIVIIGGVGVGQYATITSYNSGAKLAAVEKNDGTPGYEHLVPGTPIVATNATSVYQIEPHVTFSAPPFYSYSHETNVAVTSSDIQFCKTALIYNSVTGTITSKAGLGCTFDVTRNGSKYTVSIADGGTNFSKNDTIQILGTTLGGASPKNDLTLTITSVNSTTGAITHFDQSGLGLSGSWIMTQNASTSILESLDGETWTTTALGGTSTGPVAIANGFISDGSTTLKQSSTVIVTQSSATNQVYYSNDNITWNVTSLPGGPYNSKPSLVYGLNNFFLIFENSRHVFASNDGGANWIQYATVLPSTGFIGLTFGAERLAAILPGSTDAVYAEYQNPGLWYTTVLPGTYTWSSMCFGKNRFLAVSSGSNKAAFSLDRGETWVESDIPSIDGSTVADITQVKYSQGLFVAVASENVATSTEINAILITEDAVNWTVQGVDSNPAIDSHGFESIGFGNPDQSHYWIAKGSGSTTLISKIYAGTQAFGRASVASEKIYEIRLVEPGSGYIDGAPTITIVDPNNVYDVEVAVRTGNGALANPTIIDGGNNYLSASADVAPNFSDGYADFYQNGNYVAVRRLSTLPVPGSNIVFDHLPNAVYKLVNTVSLLGDTDGSYSGFLNLSPSLEVSESPENDTLVTMRIKYSQVRLTGHDFLDIGTGGFESTNYPGLPLVDPDQTHETVESNGGRVFYTATDQDGNFRVGGLFSVEQSTGIATLNADAFNIAGLQELTLGEVTLGGNSASINEFSTDPFMSANSDTVVPTQRAVKAYIEAQIGGGGGSLNVNTITAGDVFIGTNVITSVTGTTININAVTEFRGGVLGYPLAYSLFFR